MKHAQACARRLRYLQLKMKTLLGAHLKLGKHIDTLHKHLHGYLVFVFAIRTR